MNILNSKKKMEKVNFTKFANINISINTESINISFLIGLKLVCLYTNEKINPLLLFSKCLLSIVYK